MVCDRQFDKLAKYSYIEKLVNILGTWLVDYSTTQPRSFTFVAVTADRVDVLMTSTITM